MLNNVGKRTPPCVFKLTLFGCVNLIIVSGMFVGGSLWLVCVCLLCQKLCSYRVLQ